MTKDEALALALEALEICEQDGYIPVRLTRDSITAIKQARSAPVPEPVAWGCNRYIEDDNGFQIGTDEPELAWGKYAPDDNGWWPLYTTPPAAQPAFVQEPVAWMSREDYDDYLEESKVTSATVYNYQLDIPLYTTPTAAPVQEPVTTLFGSLPVYDTPPVQEPVTFKIYKPTPPRGAIPDVRDAELPWVYDQDPSSGNVASMWVTPVKLKEKNT